MEILRGQGADTTMTPGLGAPDATRVAFCAHGVNCFGMQMLAVSSIAAPGGSALVNASEWIASLLTGSLATSFAVLAIAGVGFGLLTGQIAVRRAVQVVVGCFVLFGAPVVVRELAEAVRGDGEAAPDVASGPPLSPPTAPRQPPSVDPYAGAAVPMD